MPESCAKGRLHSRSLEECRASKTKSRTWAGVGRGPPEGSHRRPPAACPRLRLVLAGAARGQTPRRRTRAGFGRDDPILGAPRGGARRAARMRTHPPAAVSERAPARHVCALAQHASWARARATTQFPTRTSTGPTAAL